MPFDDLSPGRELDCPAQGVSNRTGHQAATDPFPLGLPGQLNRLAKDVAGQQSLEYVAQPRRVMRSVLARSSSALHHLWPRMNSRSSSVWRDVSMR
jgi:hypothetical protein